MSSIDIIMNTRGSLTSDIDFIPSMVDSLITHKVIYFPINFLLNKKNILEAVPSTTSLTDILTNTALFTQLVKYNTNPDFGFEKITLQQAKDSGIITKNAEFMRKLWFVDNSKIIISNNQYIIVKSKLETDSVKLQKNAKPSKDIRFTMKVSVMLSREHNTIAIKRLTCAEQRENINKLYKAVFGDIFFDMRQETTTNRYPTTSALYKLGPDTDKKKPIKTLAEKEKDAQLVRVKAMNKLGQLLLNQPTYKEIITPKGGGKRSRKRRLIKRNRAHRV